MPSGPAVVVVLADANVLVKDVVSFVLYDLRDAGLIDLRWTPQVEAEYVTHRARLRAERAQRRVDAFDLMWAQKRLDRIKIRLVPDHLPPKWDASGRRLRLLRRRASLRPLLSIKDPDDVHVALAAADLAVSAGRPIVLATDNLDDLPADLLATFDVTVLHPGDLLALLYDLEPEAVSRSLLKTTREFSNPAFAPEDMLRSIRSPQQFSNEALAAQLATAWGVTPLERTASRSG